MRSVVTRVSEAQVSINGSTVGSIGKGFLVLLGVHKDDTEETAIWMADRICGLRVFEDDNGKMNVSPSDAGAQLLIVSQFTLYADTCLTICMDGGTLSIMLRHTACILEI